MREPIVSPSYAGRLHLTVSLGGGVSDRKPSAPSLARSNLIKRSSIAALSPQAPLRKATRSRVEPRSSACSKISFSRFKSSVGFATRHLLQLNAPFETAGGPTFFTQRPDHWPRHNEVVVVKSGLFGELLVEQGPGISPSPRRHHHKPMGRYEERIATGRCGVGGSHALSQWARTIDQFEAL